MMNALALCLVLISLVTAPTPSPIVKHQNHPIEEQDVIVKEGHRVVVVEYEKETDGNTKVSISPHESQSHPQMSQSPTNGHDHYSPRELVCDALGKCKHKVATAIGRAKEMVSEKAHDVSEKVHEVEEEAAEAVSEALGKAKERVSRKACGVKDAAGDAVREVSGKTKEAVSDKARRVEEGAKEVAAKAKGGAQTVFESAKEHAKEKAQGGAKMAEEATEMVMTSAKRLKEEGEKELNEILQRGREVGEKAEQATETVKTGAKRVKKEGEKELNHILRRGREVGHDVLLPYLASMMTVIHLLGFATAYGMCMWVTFVSSYVLAGALPRQQFGVVQSKIYPVYFRTMAYSVLIAMLGHLLGGKRKRWLWFNVAEMIVVYHLTASLLMILVNLLYLEPRATKVMFERIKMEKEEGRGRDILNPDPSSKAANPAVKPPATTAPGSDTTSTLPSMPRMPKRAEQEVVVEESRIVVLSEKLKKLNAYSSFLNVLTLMVLSWHLVYLGQLLHAAC